MLFRRLLHRGDIETGNALSLAATMGMHLVSGVAVGTVFGYTLDTWLDTAHWCTGIFMLAGIAAGFKNVYEDARRLVDSQSKLPKGASPGETGKDKKA